MSQSIKEVRTAVLAQFPPGDDAMYPFEDAASPESRQIDGIARSLKAQGADQLDSLRTEVVPQSSVGLLPEFETMLLLQSDKYSVTQRQAQIVSRLRESGASTIENIQAAARVIMGYSPVVVETSRAALTASHTYLFPDAVIPDGDTYTESITIHDGPLCSSMGAQLRLPFFVCDTFTGLTITLTGPVQSPAQITKQWKGGGVGGVVNVNDLTYYPLTDGFILFAPEFSGSTVGGLWTLTIRNTTGDTVEIQNAGVFVEGIGLNTTAQGLAAIIFEFAIVYDPALVSSTSDVRLMRTLASRWAPSHARGFLAVKATTGSLYGIYDDPNSTFDGCFFGT